MHPHGVSFGVQADASGNITGIYLLDGREHKEGYTYDDNLMDVGSQRYLEYLTTSGNNQLKERMDVLGFINQTNKGVMDEV